MPCNKLDCFIASLLAKTYNLFYALLIFLFRNFKTLWERFSTATVGLQKPSHSCPNEVRAKFGPAYES